MVNTFFAFLSKKEEERKIWEEGLLKGSFAKQLTFCPCHTRFEMVTQNVNFNFFNDIINV